MIQDRNAEIPQARIRQCFRRGITSYHKQARAQAQIAQSLAEMLGHCGAGPKLETVLEFGCGTGYLTGELVQRFSISDLTLNDLVAEAAPWGRSIAQENGIACRFLEGPVETIQTQKQYDLIASASTVQWITDFPRTLNRLCRAIKSGGWLALSGFGRMQFHELRALGSAAYAPNYMDLADWPAVLPAEMELVEVRQWPIVLEFGSFLDVLHHLRATGVNGGAAQGWTRSRLMEFQASYEKKFKKDGMLLLTYDAVIMVARRKHPPGPSPKDG